MTIIYPRTTNQYQSYTMYRRRRIENIEDEQRLLEEMLTLQSQIREQRERKRKTTTRDSEKYTKMLAPVTKTLQVLAQPKPPIAADLIDLSDYGGADYAVVSDTSKPPDILPPKEEISLDVPGQLFLQASSKVPMRNRDDGLLGLDTTNDRIGDYWYSVNGDTLKVHGGDGEEREYEIEDINLWKLLLAKNVQ